MTFFWGLTLGLLYYLGLWLTCIRLPYAGRPRLLAGLSFLVRLILLILLLALVARASTLRWVLALCGLTLARLIGLQAVKAKL